MTDREDGVLGSKPIDDTRFYDAKFIARMAGYMLPQLPQLFGAAAAMLVQIAAAVAVPWLVKWTIDSHIRVGQSSGLEMVLFAFVCLGAFQAVASYIQRLTVEYVRNRMLLNLRLALFTHLQGLPMSFFDANRSGNIMARVQGDVEQIASFPTMSLRNIEQIIRLIAVLAVMFALSPALALISVATAVPLIATLMFYRRHQTIPARAIREFLGVLNSHLQETISGIRVVQSLNKQKDNLDRFSAINDQHLAMSLKYKKFSSLLFPTVDILASIALALVVVIGGSFVIGESLEVGVVVAFALYIQTFFLPLREFTSHYHFIQQARAAGERIFEILDTRPEDIDVPQATPLPPIRGEIEYESVSFHYREGAPVLSDINLDISSGETVALVGPTGAGKTTLVSLLLRLYDPTEGSIRIDGRSITGYSRDSLSRQISIVLQEPYLFHGTIKDNIRYGRIGVSDEAIIRTAKTLGVHEFVEKLDHGYDTLLGERGANLSVGQRQLLSLARALTVNPRVVILDEATAYVDTETELRIQRALRETLRGRTALVIAHRLSTIRHADRIIVLDDGRIVEQGTHMELSRLRGIYARLQSYSLHTDVAEH